MVPQLSEGHLTKHVPSSLCENQKPACALPPVPVTDSPQNNMVRIYSVFYRVMYI